MRINTDTLNRIRLTVVMAFAAACAVFFGYLWVGAGGSIPLLTSSGYRVSVTIPHVSNLVQSSDVMSAGVRIGKVTAIETRDGSADVTMQLDSGPRPLHQGVTVAVRYKTLLEETFLEVTDGVGPALPDGVQLPDGAGRPAVELNDVLNSLDAPTRASLAGSIRSLGGATAGGRSSISGALSGLGSAARQGQNAIGALAAQSGQLRRLTGSASTLVAALDSRQGQIAQLVSDVDKVTQVTAGGKKDLQASMRQLPGLMDTASKASSGLGELSEALGPVASDLRAAAPDVSAALRQLPRTAADLRGLLPSLNGVLGRAPDTLARVPAVSADARALVPPLNTALRQVNPMLSYLAPYSHELTGFFVNFGQVTNTQNGVTKLMLPANEQSAVGLPGTTSSPLIDRSNPYPKPGSLRDPAPAHGPYPRIQPEGK